VKILFTFLAISTGVELYLKSSKKLISEILKNTQHDVLLTTNKLEYYDDINSSRFIVRDNVPKDSVFMYRGDVEFNYNLKYLAFKDLPEGYDVIFYIDGDIKNNFWNEESENKLKSLINSYDWVATRLNCVLRNEVIQYKTTGSALFKHKIESYEILKWNDNDTLMESHLPSEHFLIFKYNKEKLEKFATKWGELNLILQNKNGGDGSWGDGFEMGISAKYAGYDNMYDLPPGNLEHDFGFIFNGNKE
jgi:hypothetical protein